MLHCCIAGGQWRPVVGLEVHRNLDRSTAVAYHLGGLFVEIFRFRVAGQEVTSIMGRTVGAAYAILGNPRIGFLSELHQEGYRSNESRNTYADQNGHPSQSAHAP